MKSKRFNGFLRMARSVGVAREGVASQLVAQLQALHHAPLLRRRGARARGVAEDALQDVVPAVAVERPQAVFLPPQAP